MRAYYKDEIVRVLVSNKDRGWSYVEFPSGMQRNVRTKELIEIKDPVQTVTLQEALQEELAMSENTPAMTSGNRSVKNSTYNVSKYVRTKSSSGNMTLHNGDNVAEQLVGLNIEQVYDHVSRVMEVDINELKDKYAHLNVGMQRMNLGNRLRAYYKAK